jgi:hypothetical protein
VANNKLTWYGVVSIHTLAERSTSAAITSVQMYGRQTRPALPLGHCGLSFQHSCTMHIRAATLHLHVIEAICFQHGLLCGQQHLPPHTVPPCWLDALERSSMTSSRCPVALVVSAGSLLAFLPRFLYTSTCISSGSAASDRAADRSVLASLH